jgi:hypothetical protein
MRRRWSGWPLIWAGDYRKKARHNMLKLIDTLISMSLMFLILSVVASALTEAWTAALKTRAEKLKLGLIRLLGGDDNKNPNLNAVASSVLAHPWIANTAVGADEFPSYLTPQAFSAALVSTLLTPTAASAASAASGAWSTQGSIDSLRDAIKGLPIGQFQTSMLTLLDEGTQSIDDFRLRAETLFNVQMDRVSGWYKRYARLVTAMAGLILVVALNADAFRLFNDFWTNAKLRETATSIAAAMSDDKAMKEQVVKAQTALSEANLQLGWRRPWTDYQKCLSNPASDLRGCPNFSDYFEKFFGLLVSAFAVALGADFWFKSMVTLLKIRGTGPLKTAADDKSKSKGVDLEKGKTNE